MSERLDKLLQMLAKEPGDTFLLYAIALEHKKAADYRQSLEFFQKVIEKDPLYCAAFQHAGQTHELNGNISGAREAYRLGIEAAAKKGDQHAREEMEGALAMLE
jgi:tetratricopeptide (TPR) repeat protein